MILEELRHRVRRSPLGPLALAVYRLFLTPERRAVNAKGALYDRQASEVMRRTLKPDSSCVDVGAHRGSIVEEFLEHAPHGRHHAFEALPQLAAELARRFPQVTVHPAAVGDENGEADFVHVENAPAYSGLRERDYDRADPRIRHERVKVDRLDDAVPRDQAVAYVKIDIEGGEYHALKGAVELVRRCRPIIVFEAGERSTGRYGVGPDDVYRLVTGDLGCRLTTMERWLAGTPPFTAEEFRAAWAEGREYYFLASPAPDA